jgi:transcriptional regulator with XRE-family HTH domain
VAYCAVVDHKPWAHAVTARIGRRVAHFRDRAGLSAEDLSKLCAEAGLPSISRTVITKLENGRREAISVSEVQILAIALRVSVADLVFPVGEAETVEALPGQEWRTWSAVLALAGIAQRPGRPAPAYENGYAHLYQVYYQLVDDWTMAGEAHRRTILTGLRGVLSDLAERKLLIPELPKDIATAMDEGEEESG